MYGSNTVFDWGHQKKQLELCINSVKQIMEDLPTNLQIDLRNHVTDGFPANSVYSGRSREAGRSHDSLFYGFSQKERRELQFEIQKANIYVSLYSLMIGSEC